jgi:hypothetical protein
MGGSPSQTQNTSQQSQTNPWAPTVPALNNLIGNLSSVSTGVSPAQSAAVNSLLGATSSLPNFAPQAAGTANNLLSGGNANQYAPMLQSAYSGMQGSLSPLANPNNLNPMNTPGFSDALRTMNSDITNQINDQFAAAGRDLSPGNSTALARGLSQGEGNLIANQYNANAGNLMGAANSLYGAGNATAGALTGLNQAGLGNQVQGAGLAAAIPGLATQNASTALSAANTAQNQPFANLAPYEGLLTPLAALGQQSQGSGTSTMTNNVPMWQQILGGVMGSSGALGSMFGAPAGGTSAASGIGSFLSSVASGIGNALSSLAMFSDERVKDNIAEVGSLNDGTPVYSYNYIGDPVPRIGLIAQDVEKRRPDAVTEIGGIKAVDYGKATERARAIGLFGKLKVA